MVRTSEFTQMRLIRGHFHRTCQQDWMDKTERRVDLAMAAKQAPRRATTMTTTTMTAPTSRTRKDGEEDVLFF